MTYFWFGSFIVFSLAAGFTAHIWNIGLKEWIELIISIGMSAFSFNYFVDYFFAVEDKKVE